MLSILWIFCEQGAHLCVDIHPDAPQFI